MTKILLLGSTGMLGNSVLKELNKVPEFLVEGTCRINSLSSVPDSLKPLVRPFFDVEPQSIEACDDFSFFGQLKEYLQIAKPDYVLNAIGTIKPFSLKDPARTVYVNGVFPHQLAEVCKQYGTKLIHITTDCVYSGKLGMYFENFSHDALDLYGKSKSVGEPLKDCMTIRTSIIGEEIQNNVSLVAWARSQAGKKVNGFTNHRWNGITTNQYAKNITQIIQENLWSEGTYHVFAKQSVNKYELLCLLSKYLELNLTIEPIEANESIERTLATSYPLNALLNNPTVEKMVAEMAEENQR